MTVDLSSSCLRALRRPTHPTQGPIRFYTEAVTLTNFGRGPAFECLYVHVVNPSSTWCFLRLSGLGGDHAVQRGAVSLAQVPRHGSCSQKTSDFSTTQ